MKRKVNSQRFMEVLSLTTLVKVLLSAKEKSHGMLWDFMALNLPFPDKQLLKVIVGQVLFYCDC